jgi:hypothetical protein
MDMQTQKHTVRDNCLYYKEGYKYWVNRHYHVRIDIFPEKDICVFFETDEINGNPVKIPVLSLDRFGNLIFHPGYVWDGASGPTFDTLNSMIASLIHDGLYQLIRLGFIGIQYKKYADELLRLICIEDGMFECRAGIWYIGVANFGNDACKPSSEHLEMVAP